jgi:hypothetical protein
VSRGAETAAGRASHKKCTRHGKRHDGGMLHRNITQVTRPNCNTTWADPARITMTLKWFTWLGARGDAVGPDLSG